LANFASGLEAEMAVERLRVDEIPAMIDSHSLSGVFGPGFQGATGRGVNVLVPAVLLDEARIILGLDPEPPDEDDRPRKIA
jgi:hypothetical protein